MLFLYIFLFISSVYSLEVKPVKLCVNCKHFLLEHSLANQENGKCLLFPQEQTSDYFFVDGINNKKKIDYHYCATARNLHHMCGEEGQFFIKK